MRNASLQKLVVITSARRWTSVRINNVQMAIQLDTTVGLEHLDVSYTGKEISADVDDGFNQQVKKYLDT